MFSTLELKDGIFYVTRKKAFRANVPISEQNFKDTANFAYKMSFGKEGQHRDHRTGGTHRRKKGEIFCNVFQGKLSEFAAYNYLTGVGLQLDSPDMSVSALGEWDVTDLIVNGQKISIKSTKSFGQLLLLETKDWLSNGVYKPNEMCYDYFVMVRIDPNLDKIFSKARLLYADEVETSTLVDLVKSQRWKAEVSGYFTNEQFVKEVIEKGHILPAGSHLNSKFTKMDAENYYIQIGDMTSIDKLKDAIEKRGKSD